MGSHATAAEGGGWVEFADVHPIKRTAVGKMMYALPAQDLVVGCSVNKVDG
jgi:hypothetical protein